MCNEVDTTTFIFGIISGIAISCFIAAIYHMNYLKVKRYFKISFREYTLLDDYVQNALTDSANHKLHMEILARTEKEN